MRCPNSNHDEDHPARTSRSKRAGLIFPIGRILRFLKDGKYAKRVGISAAVYLTAVIEYIVSEVLELGGNAALDNGRLRVSPRHMQLAIQMDCELAKFFRKTTIPHGGVLPHIEKVLLPKGRR